MAERHYETTGGETLLTASIAEVLEDKAARGDEHAEDWAETLDDFTDEDEVGFLAAAGAFVRRHPIVALAATLAAGYALAQLRRRR